MTRDLQQLRKDAGYKSSRDFADACGFTYSTYARYEGEPAIIPTKSAWKIADVLGCTIDDVVGRDAPKAEVGNVQARYEALDAEGRALVDEILELAESKHLEREEAARRKAEEEHRREFTYYLLSLVSAKAAEGEPLKTDEEKTEEFASQFKDYVMRAIANEAAPVEEGVIRLEGVMRAYEAWVSGDF